MNTVKKQKGLLLLSKEKLDCYILGAPAVVSLSFPPNVIRSMDVVDRAGLTALIHTFIQTNKFIPATFSLLLHESLLFEKLISPPQKPASPATPPLTVQTQQAASTLKPSPSQTPQVLSVSEKNSKTSAQEAVEEEESVIQQFTDSVPFEEVLVKTMKTAQGKLIIVANKDLITAITDSFEKDGFITDTVIPMTLLGKDVTTGGGLTLQSAPVFFSKIDAYKGQSMLTVAPVQTGPVAMGMPQKESDKKRLIVMIGVFGVLVVVLIVFYLRMTAENAAPAQTNLAQPEVVVQPTIVEAPVISLEPASSSAELKLSYPIDILGVTKNASLAATLDTALRQSGYQFITKKQQGTAPAATIVTFTADVPEDIRQEIVGLLTVLDPSLVIQENVTENNKVTISLP